MKLKIILVIFLLLKFLWEQLLVHLTWVQRNKPLPEIVSHIYSKERYDSYISYKKEYKKVNLITNLFSLTIEIIIILSNFYTLFDYSNPYLCVVLTLLATGIISKAIEIPLDYYSTFNIEEKYGLNKKTKREWLKDILLNLVMEIIMSIVLYGFVVFVCSNIQEWTNNFEINYAQSFIFCLLIALAFFAIMVLLSLLSLVMLKVQYKFTEMEDNDLRKKIEGFLNESKKKVKHIKVYNESKKSTSKNAFMLKLLWYREFGIADNFLNENAEDELLAVLLHEIGHLKHKKNIYNYLKYLFILLIFMFFVWLIPNARYIIDINAYVNNSFNLKYTNYILSTSILVYAYTPLSLIMSIFNNYVSCKEEQEADFNAVDHGYGQALIDTFTKLSSDELIDVNPHPFVELVEYDHPGMYRRISYIKNRQKTKK